MKIEEKYLKLKDSAPTEELPKIPEKLRTKLKEA